MKIFFDKSKKSGESIIENKTNVFITPIKHPKREIIIDLLRGFAVLVMVITHVIAITYSGGSSIVYFIGQFGGIVSFTAFLFISGMSTYFSALKPEYEDSEDLSQKRRKKFGRLIKLLFAYYILATVSIFVNTTLYSFPPSFSWVQNITKTIFLLIIPGFSEFLIPLFIFALSVYLFPKFYKFLSKNPLFGLIFMSVIYLIGHLISLADLRSNELNTIKAILGGQTFSTGSLHTFPVFQYFSIFLIGIYLGHFYYSQLQTGKRLKILLLLLIILGVLTLAGTLSYSYLQSNLLFPFPDQGRFPPSITFLTLSLGLTILVLLILQLSKGLIPSFLKTIMRFFGTYAIEALIFHTLVLFAYQYATASTENPNGIKHLTFTDVVIIYAIVLLITFLFITIKNYIRKWVLKEKEYDTVWWFFTERAVSSLVLVIVFGFIGTNIYQEVFVKTANADANNFILKKNLIHEEDSWWDNDYTAYKVITIKNTNSSLPLFDNSWISLNFNHAEAIAKGYSQKGGNDIRIVFFNTETAKYQVIPFLLKDPETAKAQITFKLLQTINPGDSSGNYFIYYGNESASRFEEPKDKYSTPPYSEGISLGKENIHPLSLSIGRKWFLKDIKNAPNLELEATIQSNEISKNSVVKYSVIGTNKQGKMTANGEKEYKASFKVNDLKPGNYSIQAIVTDPDNSLKVSHSKSINFYVSYPLYVSWTFDWEGWDVGQNDLNAIINVENTYGIKSTHFFNPRIYVKNQSTQNNTIGIISTDRANYLTTWIKDRQLHGDEIGMHIHMWQDMLKEAEVVPKTGPIIAGTYGSDVPAYAYPQSDLEKVFTWGKNKFIENGLGIPISFRTGAWMARENVLKAAENTGFLIDSSGRTGGLVNANVSYSTPIPWTLTDTTTPYLPNANNINKWDAQSSDRLDIWEFSNNGADSYWFTKEELIKRFDENFSNKSLALTRPQTLVYLTHPHWFTTVDYWKIIALFDYIKQYKYENDGGPVVFDTLKNIYNSWDKTKFYNGN